MDLHGPACGTPEKLAWIDEHPLPVAAPLPHYADPAVCLEPAAIARQEQVSGSYTKARSTEHFFVAYDPTNSVLTEAMLTLATDALERSWTVQVEEGGWRAPDQTDTCLITVVLADVDDSGSGTGGWTNVNEEGGVPFIVINTDWFADGDEWTTTLLAHEFNHASQFGYNRFWDESDWWYWESTAEWSTELVYPDANAWNFSLWSYFANPGFSLDSQRQLVNYGHFTFNVYLTEQVDADAPVLAWEAATTETDVAAALSGALDADFNDLLLGYTAHAGSMDVTERDEWLATLGYFEVDPYAAVIASYPSTGASSEKKAPQGRGQNFVHLRGEPSESLVFAFEGETAVGERETDWAVTLSTLADDGSFVHETFATESGAVSVTIADLGRGVSDAYVGVIPLNDFGETSAGWTWDVRTVSGAEAAAACGCDGGAGVFSPVALGVAALVVRRRRSGRAPR